MYQAYITKITNIRNHPNADRLLLGECFGNTVCVSTDYSEGMVGVYFPTDGQLSVEFAEYNNLVRKKDDAGNNIGGYMDPEKRNVTAIKLRGEKSDGLFLPLKCLDYCYSDNNAADKLNIGDVITVVNGHEICTKYIPRKQNRQGHVSEGNRTRKKKNVSIDISPLFQQHVDTEQLPYNHSAFKYGDEVEITLKMHGTSQRTGYLPVFKGYKRTLMDKILHREGKPIYDWGYVSGTRRTILHNFEGGYYGSNEFREAHSKLFEGKLNKGEEVFYEVVGFTHTGTPIMASCDNKKLNDKEFVKQYGQSTTFSYGCVPFVDDTPADYVDEIGELALAKSKPQSDIYVYRMTMTNEDGFTVEYTPDFMRYRCEQMGVKTVPTLWRGFIPEGPIREVHYESEHNFIEREMTAGEWVQNLAETYYDGPDPIGKTHVREGVVVRILNRPRFSAYKLKNWYFKALEGIVKVEADAPDIEEEQEVFE